MKRIIAALAVLGLMTAAHASWQSRDSNYNVSISGSGPPAHRIRVTNVPLTRIAVAGGERVTNTSAVRVTNTGVIRSYISSISTRTIAP